MWKQVWWGCLKFATHVFRILIVSDYSHKRMKRRGIVKHSIQQTSYPIIYIWKLIVCMIELLHRNAGFTILHNELRKIVVSLLFSIRVMNKLIWLLDILIWFIIFSNAAELNTTKYLFHPFYFFRCWLELNSECSLMLPLSDDLL